MQVKGARDILLTVNTERIDMPLLESAGWHGIRAAIPSINRSTSAFHITYVSEQEATWRVGDGDKLVEDIAKAKSKFPSMNSVGFRVSWR
jgi:hypothetical protein